MADSPINLNKARKAHARAANKREADRNSVVHGLSKAARKSMSAADAGWKARVDGAKRARQDDEDTP